MRHFSEKRFQEFLIAASFVERFASVRDPRIERNKRYPLMESLLLAVCAMLSGPDGWEAIADFGKEKLERLRKFAPYANGLPAEVPTVGRD